MFNTPILFLIFNRPDNTSLVFEEIRKIKPRYLYVAADGPRADKLGEKELCEATRAIISQVDWPCELKTLFRDYNLGCGKAVSEAITWFFNSVEQGIILEDDCLPDSSFFTFCEVLLEKYKNDDRVSTIGATNYQLVNNTTNSYYFSIYSHVWGWASWRRTWQLYNYSITDYDKKIIDRNFNTTQEINYWKAVYGNNNFLAKINTWDYQLQFINFKYNMLSIIPSVNLVKNIGLNVGTHIIENVPDFHYKRRFGSINNIASPKKVERDFKADLYFYNNMLKIDEPTLGLKLKRKIYSIYKLIIK